MVGLTESDKIYITEMDAWIEEQKLRCEELKYAVNNSKRIMELNQKQIQLMIKKYNIGITEHNKWLEEKGISEIIPLMDEYNGTEE